MFSHVLADEGAGGGGGDGDGGEGMRYDAIFLDGSMDGGELDDETLNNLPSDPSDPLPLGKSRSFDWFKHSASSSFEGVLEVDDASAGMGPNGTKAVDVDFDDGAVRFGLQVCHVRYSTKQCPELSSRPVSSSAQASELLQNIGVPSHMIQLVPIEFSEAFAAEKGKPWLRENDGFWTRVVVGPYRSEEDAAALINDPERKLIDFAPDACVVEFPQRASAIEARVHHSKKR
mmetsp:Transcript_11892/g.21008  ORF Transcript_11892/g.21008 Transcript_11892/m.21008 type:complete len:231 (-) Transcript_11892:102-794(-)